MTSANRTLGKLPQAVPVIEGDGDEALGVVAGYRRMTHMHTVGHFVGHRPEHLRRARPPRDQCRHPPQASGTGGAALHLARHLTHHLAPHLRLLRWLDTEFLVDLRPVLEAVRG